MALTQRLNRAGGFMVSRANGYRAMAGITLVSGQNLQAGRVLGKITASGKYKEYNPGNSDGSEVVAGILWDDTDATSADKKAAAVVRAAEVNQGEISWFSGASGGQITAGIAGLTALGVICRPSVPA
jgi:hypothetical protein